MLLLGAFVTCQPPLALSVLELEKPTCWVGQTALNGTLAITPALTLAPEQP